ncbi:hypothetical protein PR048_001369 [Dryococelus australis]|uniref:Uncharacterized protein n=1 Tax=Dryococelus australis TaxID=614101 RepID=A0ABQ9IH53_9NEOP|nr:hypothetical protein PR048_001369 [Dryococelus australis]
MSVAHDIRASLEEFCGVLFSSSEQHVDEDAQCPTFARPAASTSRATILGGAAVLYLMDNNSTKAAEQEQWNRMKKLITLLKSQLNENGIESRQAPGDADLLIVTTAIDKSKPLDKSTVAVIGGDIDLAVLLMAKTPPDQDILLVKPGRGKIKTNVYSTKEMEQLGLNDLLFLLASTGCDTTLAAFRKNMVAQQWLGNELSPELWGWARTPGNHLAPGHTEDPVTPEEIFKMIFYRCTKDCSGGKCGCRKASLTCSAVCDNYNGNCLNCKLENEEDDDEEIVLPPTLVEELDENMEENIEDEDEEYEPQPRSHRHKRSKLL